MGFFDLIEKGINKGASAVGDALSKAGEATDGWGEKTDAWLADDTKFDKVKDTINDLADKATEFFDKAAGNDSFMKDSDIVDPEPAPAASEPAAPAPAPASAPTAPPVVKEASEPVPAVKEDIEYDVVATTYEDEIVVPVAVVEPTPVKEKAKAKPAKTKASATVPELRQEAKELGVKNTSKLKKDELVKAIKTAKRKKN